MHAVGVWQSLMDVGALNHGWLVKDSTLRLDLANNNCCIYSFAVTQEYPFLDKHIFYRWAEDESGPPGVALALPTEHDQQIAEAEFTDVLVYLSTVGPEALFRTVLSKPLVSYPYTPRQVGCQCRCTPL